ncbi:ATPase components of ABC transporters [Candidatus Scalindua japonica]|uniref:ATPase components of ABC transporters n=1 Tax=Candidatus Scalindua japonica TaxID=1284222 RepID=A0A286TVA9_9BACT|nr:ABC-F family ATP-binding cassette domain-containing protein [Candidatus Scalindua japonica]GAX59823.1 ATPase components of ABC transporters [Candidatus Scalindua japonica]
MISVQSVSKQYLEQVIFDNISFNLNTRERTALVGRNGHGKTTLFRMLTGEEQCDEGIIAIPKNYRIGYLSQHINFTKPTVLEEGCSSLPDDRKDDDWRVKSVLSGLGFSENDFDRDPAEFSGGYQIRLNLAKVLVSAPNLLLLDEPTNFLDIVSIRWLTGFLNNWQNEIVIISHDRGFTDSVATHTLGIHRHKVVKIKGGTQEYYDRISKAEEIHEKRRLNEDKKRKQAENFINSFRAKAGHASLVQSRVKSLEKQEVLKKLEKISTLSFSFNSAPFPAKSIMETQDLTFSYDDNNSPLIDHINFNVESNDKICIIGKNGKGKTTLLKLLAGILSPCEGKIRSHPQTKVGYYEQANTATLNDQLTVEEEIASTVSSIERGRVRSICGAMMFSGDSALKKIKVLSGGEKCRTLLGKLLVLPTNLLLLDEPTHHLDMQSCEAMMDAIDNFNGAVLMVTHNEHILHRIANKLVVFHHDRIFFFHGTYAQFLEQIGWDDQDSITPGEKSSKQEGPQSLNKKDKRKVRAEFTARRSKALAPFEKKIREIEKKIEKSERELHLDTESLIKASQDKDGVTISRLSKSIKHAQNHIDTLYESLEETNEEYELNKTEFDEEARSLK